MDALRPDGSGQLAPVGLTGSEEVAYELLVDRPASTFDELAPVWNGLDPLPEVLSALEAKGLVVRVVGTPERFEAVDPAVALEALVLTAEEQLNKVREQSRQLTELYRSTHRVDTGRSVVELVVGSQAMRRRVVQVLRSAREELRCLDRPPYVDSRGTTEIAFELLARAVACRTIYASDAVEQPGTLADIEQLATAGEQARVLPTVPLKLYLVDDRLALLAIQRRPTDLDAALVIHSSGLLDALSSLFESLWRRAIPFDLAVHPAAEDAGRTKQPDRQRLIALLLSGLTDQAIARQLGVGYRTVQRRLAELMDELGASTRFQAGVQAALLAGRRSSPSAGRD